jgi:hypothetical protein
LRAEQTVSEMVVESLARQADALSERTGQPFEGAFTEVLETPAGRKLAELADGPHRHEKAVDWQAGLMADREAQRPVHLRELEGQRPATRGLSATWSGRRARPGARNTTRSYATGSPPWRVEPPGSNHRALWRRLPIHRVRERGILRTLGVGGSRKFVCIPRSPGRHNIVINTANG